MLYILGSVSKCSSSTVKSDLVGEKRRGTTQFVRILVRGSWARTTIKYPSQLIIGAVSINGIFARTSASYWITFRFYHSVAIFIRCIVPEKFLIRTQQVLWYILKGRYYFLNFKKTHLREDASKICRKCISKRTWSLWYIRRFQGQLIVNLPNEWCKNSMLRYHSEIGRLAIVDF